MRDIDKKLIEASWNGHLEVVKELLKQGANVHTCDDYALRWAAAHGHLEVVRELLAQGANLHARNDRALQWAKDNEHTDIVKYLKRYVRLKEIRRKNLTKKENMT